MAPGGTPPERIREREGLEWDSPQPTMASRCYLTGATESLDALDARLEDADRWALRQTCAGLRARFADRTRLSLRSRPELLPHAIERMSADSLPAATLLCAELGEVALLATLLDSASEELMTTACLVAAVAGRPEVLRLVRERAGASLPWSTAFTFTYGQRELHSENYNVIDIASMRGHMDVAELARREGCPMSLRAPIEACMAGNVAVLDWYFTHEGASWWRPFLIHIAAAAGRISVVEWAAGRGLDLDLERTLDCLNPAQRGALLAWMARRDAPIIV